MGPTAIPRLSLGPGHCMERTICYRSCLQCMGPSSGKERKFFSIVTMKLLSMYENTVLLSQKHHDIVESNILGSSSLSIQYYDYSFQGL